MAQDDRGEWDGWVESGSGLSLLRGRRGVRSMRRRRVFLTEEHGVVPPARVRQSDREPPRPRDRTARSDGRCPTRHRLCDAGLRSLRPMGATPSCSDPRSSSSCLPPSCQLGACWRFSWVSHDPTNSQRHDLQVIGRRILCSASQVHSTPRRRSWPLGAHASGRRHRPASGMDGR